MILRLRKAKKKRKHGAGQTGFARRDLRGLRFRRERKIVDLILFYSSIMFVGRGLLVVVVVKATGHVLILYQQVPVPFPQSPPTSLIVNC